MFVVFLIKLNVIFIYVIKGKYRKFNLFNIKKLNVEFFNKLKYYV